MANLYGVANPVIAPVFQLDIGNTNLVCTAGAETNVIDSGALVAISNGYYYPYITFTIAFAVFASAPTALTINGRIGAGADFANVPIQIAGLQANSNPTYSGVLVGPSTQSTWITPGAHVFVSVTPTAQNVNVYAVGSYAYFSLYRAPDQ